MANPSVFCDPSNPCITDVPVACPLCTRPAFILWHVAGEPSRCTLCLRFIYELRAANFDLLQAVPA